jgi:regulatory subunit for Cdc7p protein kinase
MVREYPKVSDKKLGEWPQFRVASQGRCPFVEDQPERPVKIRERVTKAAEVRAPVVECRDSPEPNLSLQEWLIKHGRDQNPNYRRSQAERESARVVEKQRLLPSLEHRKRERDEQHLDKAGQEKTRLEFDQENAFMSRAKAPRFVAGEPVASGVQPSKLTSAIRSQMISSTSGVLGGVKAGTSKEIHGLQRKVLQKNSTPAVSQDLSSRRLGEMSHDSNTFIRSTSVCRPSVRGKLDMIDEDGSGIRGPMPRRTESAPAPAPEKQKKRDLKPGYCENCADKFDDFDEVCLCDWVKPMQIHD